MSYTALGRADIPQSGGQPRYQTECQILRFADKANERDDNLGDSNYQHQVPELDAYDRIGHRQYFGGAESAPNLGGSSDGKNCASTENEVP